MLVALTTVTCDTLMPVPAADTLAPDIKLVPVKVTVALLPWVPLAGEMDVSVGAGALTVKFAVPDVPPAVVTATV